MTLSRRQCLPIIGLVIGGLAFARGAAADDQRDPRTDKQQFQRYSIDQESMTLVTITGNYPFLVDVIMNQEKPDSAFRARAPVQPDEGMLYAYDVVRQIGISNHGVPFATDLMFITADGRIIEIHPMIMPNSDQVITSNIPVKAALQVIAGTVRRLDITPGDHVLLPLFGRTL
jgi:uncharacterized protein